MTAQIGGSGRRLAGLLGAAAVLLASGCRLDLAVEVDLDAHGGGELALAVAAAPELVAAAADAGADPLTGLAEAARDAGDGWEVTEATAADGAREVRVSTDFAGPDEFDRLTAALAEELVAPEVALLDELRVLLSEERISVEGRAGLAPTRHVGELGYDVDEATARLADHVSYQLRITMPGAVLATTADEHAAQTLVWAVPAGEQVRVHAVGERPETPLARLLPIVVAAALLVVLAVAVGYALVFSPRRRSFSRRT